jgi:hypothetical protein
MSRRDEITLIFTKSDIGAQSAWKGYSSQTLYIASRIMGATANDEYYPEHLEDLLIKRGGQVIEVVQVKDLSDTLTISDLASTKASRSEEGFFKRTCSLRNAEPMLQTLRIVYFGELGKELQELSSGSSFVQNKIKQKLIKDHGLSDDEALWILARIDFQKVDSRLLEEEILQQLQSYVPTMAAPELARTLLIQYISELSKTKGRTSLALWQEKIYNIGADIAAMDGYYKEYQKSLIRLCDMTSDKSADILQHEFSQGVSTHPEHIRNDLDFARNEWLEKISLMLSNHKALIIMGVSGQGKTALCHRFLLDNYPEQLVFCVRHIQSTQQAENLVRALQGIVKHTQDIILYIDVNPGEPNWTLLLQEIQARGVSVPILVSIREEDFKLSKVDRNAISIDVIELYFSQIEAANIYKAATLIDSHPQFRSFEDAWQQFGEGGPFLEFVYLLNHNQTLRQRLLAQIERLISEKSPDSWFMLLNLVCYAGKIGCPVLYEDAKQQCSCDTAIAALDRMSKEYLLKNSDDGRYIEALHPLRAAIIYSILQEKISYNPNDLLIMAVKCVENRYPQLLLMDYFTHHPFNPSIIIELTSVLCRDWTMYACMLNTMLWLDVKLYAERNREFYDELIEKKGNGWLPFLPLDISGELRPNEFIIEDLEKFFPKMAYDVRKDIDWVRNSLTSVIITYEATDLWVKNSNIPRSVPQSDTEWSDLGYALFWLAKRKRIIQLSFLLQTIHEATKTGDIQAKADVAAGLYFQGDFDCYAVCEAVLRERIIEHFRVIKLSVTDTEVSCAFVSPYFDDNKNSPMPENFNHFLVMNMVDLLSKLYPDKEYVEAKLIGVDLLSDLGITAMDYHKRINRSHLPYAWITEINSWLLSRFNYGKRPEDWKEYVHRVDAIRQNVLDLVHIIIRTIDYIYIKGFIDKERIEKLQKAITSFKNLMHNEFLLPKNVVDPYCLYSESMGNKDLNKLMDTKSPTIYGLSLHLYENFKKSFNNAYCDFENFLNSFSDILASRIKREEIDQSKNPRLTLFNLYETSKALFQMQQEYSRLFLSYAAKDYFSFERNEREEMLTLLNIWHHVLSNPPRRSAVSYDAKQCYRKTGNLVKEGFEKGISRIGRAIDVDESTGQDSKVVYLLKEYDPFQQIPIENMIKDVCLKLREHWKEATGFQSMRWYLETQWPKMVFVPLYKGIPISMGFQMYLYKILDADEEQFVKSLFPTRIPVEIYNQLDIDLSKIEPWLNAIRYVGKLRLLLIQYNDVVKHASDETDICEQGLRSYLDALLNDIIDTITQLLKFMEPGIRILSITGDSVVAELFDFVIASLRETEAIDDIIKARQPFEELPEQLKNAVGIMVCLTSYISINS